MINILSRLEAAAFRRLLKRSKDNLRKLNEDHKFSDCGWDCNHGETIPGEKLQASFDEILSVLFFVASYDSRYVKCITLLKFHVPSFIPKILILIY